MLPSRQNLQITNIVVIVVPIFMMHNISFFQHSKAFNHIKILSIKQLCVLLYYPTMFRYPATSIRPWVSWHINQDINDAIIRVWYFFTLK